VIVAYDKGKGGSFIFKRYSRNRIKDLFFRLSMEVQDSVYLALQVNQILNKLGAKNKIIVHLDISSSIKFETDKSCKSGQYMSTLIGRVVSQGFE